ncbi:MAG TPA: cytochrome c biogenesis protein ResB [Actinopolymorphaceae bacterium]|jgi:cytochrome c biogenesis protein
MTTDTTTATTDAGSDAAPPGSTPPPRRVLRGAIEWARWSWRQLTSMRTALLLLFLLALAAIPGSIVPQSRINPIAVVDFATRHPHLAPWYHRFGLFDVFGSPWFAAIYLLLMVSLVGCIVPRLGKHLKAIRAIPPKAPQRLRRLPAHREWHVGGRADGADVDAVLRDAKVAFERQHYRVLEGTDADGRRWVGAERGRHRETGNLLFHIAVLVVLLGMAVVSLFGFKGTALVIVGNGFSNTITQYDGYTAGRLFKPSRLEPFNLAFTNFIVKFEESGATKGAAREFDATMQVTPEPGEPTVTDHLKVNHPLHIGNEQVHLIGHGYAPIVTVKDGNGNVAWSGPVAFLPQDGNFSSTGVIKVPDARPDEIGLQGLFLPSAHVDPVKGPISVFPDAENPALFLTAYIGNLGLDDGTPQSIYSLDTTGLTQLTKDGQPFRVAMLPGDTEKLPGNAGTITYEGYKRWANLQISSRPGTMIVLVGAVAALVGLMGSLFIPRRRAWVRVENDAGRTVIVLAGLDQRTSGGERVSEGLAVDLTKIAADLGDEKATAELDDAGAGDADADAENERTQS